MRKRIVVALDYDNRESAMNLVEELTGLGCVFKIGLQMFTHLGPDFVRTLVARGHDVFLDLKFYDIPNTVAGAVRAACELGVWMITVHALGGAEMLQSARKAVDLSQNHKPFLIGVTLLTSLDQQDLLTITRDTVSLDNYVSSLALVAKNNGLDGVVCSANEVPLVRDVCGKDFLLVTPGIRLVDMGDDQKRVVTPQKALRLGADCLVLGRPITQSARPREVVIGLLNSAKF